jgi:hypothetical protein
MQPFRALRSVRLLSVVVATGLMACGGSTEQSTPQSASAPANTAVVPAANQQPAAQQPQTTVEPTTTPATVPAPASTAQSNVNPLVQDHESGAQVTLLEVKRTGGDSVTLKWRYQNTGTAPLKVSKGGSAWLDAYQLTAETFMVDPVNKKKYMVITDEKKYPLASKHGDWQGVTLQPGQNLTAWAKLPAPPPDVEKVTITLPGMAPFENVQVAK